YIIAHVYGRYAYRAGTNRKVTLGIDPYFSRDEKATRLYVFPTASIDYYGISGSLIRAGIYGEVQNPGRNGHMATSTVLNYSQQLLNNRGWVMFVNYELELMNRSSIYAGFDLKRYTKFGYINYVVDAGNPALFSHDIAYNEAQ